MPMVNGKKFAYTPKGMKSAKDAKKAAVKGMMGKDMKSKDMGKDTMGKSGY
jgi:hypothetical protein